MTSQYWLQIATDFLLSKGVLTARLDCLVLLEDMLKIDRAQILAKPDTELSEPQVAELQKLLIRRSKHEPLAYVRGRSEFYGRNFKMSHAVLEPRPESETMIELLKAIDDLPANRKIRIADVGSGSGALGITAALELSNASVDLLEIDTAALAVSRTNVDLFGLSLACLQSNLINNSPQDYDILLCNLPYVPDAHTINAAALHEPKIAIFGGLDGLDLYRQLFKLVKKLTNLPRYILTESLPPQHIQLATIAEDHGYRLAKTDDFIQLFKYDK